jgi:hypothetical protein
MDWIELLVYIVLLTVTAPLCVNRTAFQFRRICSSACDATLAVGVAAESRRKIWRAVRPRF